MKTKNSNVTYHASQQMIKRDIPENILDWLESYGESCKCRDGGKKIAFSKSSRTQIRRDLGRTAVRDLDKYRNIYAVACDGRIVTVARSRKPLFR